jgi:hypothetical protein
MYDCFVCDNTYDTAEEAEDCALDDLEDASNADPDALDDDSYYVD